MTADEAIRQAVMFFNRVKDMPYPSTGPETAKAYSLKAMALAEAGKGYVELAKLLDSRKASE